MDSKTVKNSNAETLDKSALSVRGGGYLPASGALLAAILLGAMPAVAADRSIHVTSAPNALAAGANCINEILEAGRSMASEPLLEIAARYDRAFHPLRACKISVLPQGEDKKLLRLEIRLLQILPHVLVKRICGLLTPPPP